MIKMVQRLQSRGLVKQKVAAHKIRECLEELVAGKGPEGHAKNVVEFLEGALLGFRHKAVDEAVAEDIKTGVEAEGALEGESGHDTKEGQRQHCAPKVDTSHSPAHADLPVRQREHLGTVRERNRPSTRGINNGKQVYEEGKDA